MSSLEETERYSAARSTHPRVSLADVEAAIAEKFFALGDYAIGRQHDQLRLLTLCFLVMRNGFVVVGKSAPASPENFDIEKGRTFAYEDAVRQLWPLMGYALRDRLAHEAAS